MPAKNTPILAQGQAEHLQQQCLIASIVESVK